MISTEILYGQGLGNQLACYVTTRVLAADKGVDFGIHDPNNCLGDKRFNSKGLYFMDLDKGKPVNIDNIKLYYNEIEYRYFSNSCYHDYHHGCWVNITDENLKNIPDNSHILGIMQGPDYFYHRIDEIKNWLKLKPKYDNYEFSSDDICIINFRATMDPWVLLNRTYWSNAINHMLNINPHMSFLVITENTNEAINMLPELKENIYHFGVGEDYAIIKNAKYLIASNSSFSIFPVLTSDTLKYAIAPKYMLRHNISDGYWSQGYNIYKNFIYMDKFGKLFNYDECIKEFYDYDKTHNFYKEKVKKCIGNWPDVATIKPK